MPGMCTRPGSGVTTQATSLFEQHLRTLDQATNTVSLKLSDGSQVQVPLRRLSSADRYWLKQEAQQQTAKATEVSGIRWVNSLNDATEIATGSEDSADDKPIMCFRVLGDVAGFM